MTWRGLAWVAARQHRTALTACGVLYAVAALLLAVNGTQMRNSYAQLGLAHCIQHPQTVGCIAGMFEFTQDYLVWVHLIPLLLLAVPALTGVFAGGPVLGQDLDRGTFRFAWTQGAGRARLLTTKLIVLGGLPVAASAGIAALTAWWFSPLYALGNGRLAPQFFVPLGPAFAAWTLLAFALGAAAGAVVRRVVPAIAAALVAWTGLAAATDIWLRRSVYRAPLRITSTFQQFVGQLKQGGVQISSTIDNGPPPRAYGITSWWVGPDGRVLRDTGPFFGSPPSRTGRPGTVAPHTVGGIHIITLYQPDSRFWPFQWIETGWLALLAALLLAVAFYLSRRPHPIGIGLGHRAADTSAGTTAPIRPIRPIRAAATDPDTTQDRELTWRGLAWVACRQHRTAMLGCAALFTAAALLLLLNGLAMRGLIQQLGLNGCQKQDPIPLCTASSAQFRQDFGTWIGLVPILILLVPVSAGAFAGAAVVARDFERGTFRFAWTQGCGGPRLLATRVAVIATVLVLGSAAVATLAGWWFSPLYALGYVRLDPQYFGTQGPAFVAWTLLAFATAVLAGSVLRRVVVAVATTLAAYAGLAVPAGIVLRYRYYRPPVTVTAALGQTSPSMPPRSVPIGTWWIGTGGTAIPRAQVEHAISSLQPAALVRWLLQHDTRLVVTYQPDSRFWPFQWTETAWLSALAGLLLAAALVLARPRTFSRPAVVRFSAATVALAGAICAASIGLAAAGGTHPAAPAPTATTPAATTPTATTTAPDAHGPGYLALGDSVAFGDRPESVTPAADYLNPADFTGYPEDLAKALGLRLVNASCPGETAASMINPSAPDNGCETSANGSPGYRDAFPLHVSYQGSQLSYAVRYLEQHPRTELVTIDIGANDMFRCQDTTADDCTGADFGRALAGVTRNLDTILNALRNQAHYRHTIVVLTYYALNYGDRTSVLQTEALNEKLAGPAARYQARLADGFTAFRTAAARAARTAGNGGDSCAAGLLIRLPSGGCDEHPSDEGQRVLATVIERAIGPRTATARSR